MFKFDLTAHSFHFRKFGEASMSIRSVDFIIAGFMRCGTTSMYYELAQHPEISMSRKKETDYFTSDCDPKIYEAQFNKSKIFWGEASPNYSKFDIFPGVPKKIKSHSPNVKIIFLVRDPCNRIVSQYRHALAMGNLTRSDDISINSDPMKHMLNTSRYFAQLSKFREHFEKDHLLIIKMEDYIKDRKGTLDHVADFIGATKFDWTDNHVAENASLALAKYPNIMKSLRKSALLQKLYNATPFKWQTKVKNLFTYKSYCIESKVSEKICRDELLSHLRDDIRSFGNEYNIDVTKWLIGEKNDT